MRREKVLICILVFFFWSTGLFAQKKMSESVLQIFKDQWEVLSGETEGCLTGGQYCASACGSEGCCFNINAGWVILLNIHTTEWGEFLIDQMSDSAKSSVHVCPYKVATKGELAVYALQYIYKKNWYDLDVSYQKYVDGTLKPLEDFHSLQEVLQAKLADPKERQKLIDLWRKVVDSQN